MEKVKLKKCGVQFRYDMEMKEGTESAKIHKNVGLKDFGYEEWVPRLVIGFCQFIQSLGFPLTYVAPVLAGEGVMLSIDPEKTLENVYETLSILEEGLESGEFDVPEEVGKHESKGMGEAKLSLQKHLDSLNISDTPVTKILDFESFVQEFEEDESFRKFMYKLYTQEVSE